MSRADLICNISRLAFMHLDVFCEMMNLALWLPINRPRVSSDNTKNLLIDGELFSYGVNLQ